jgi:hypothetical protein
VVARRQCQRLVQRRQRVRVSAEVEQREGEGVVCHRSGFIQCDGRAKVSDGAVKLAQTTQAVGAVEVRLSTTTGDAITIIIVIFNNSS